MKWSTLAKRGVVYAAIIVLALAFDADEKVKNYLP